MRLTLVHMVINCWFYIDIGDKIAAVFTLHSCPAQAVSKISLEKCHGCWSLFDMSCLWSI